MAGTTLTQAKAKSWPVPASGRVEIPDDRERGLYLRVTANGARSWCFRGRTLAGRSIRITLDQLEDMSLAAARDEAVALRAALRRGEDPAAAKRSCRGEMTLGELFDVYMQQHAKHKRTGGEDARTWAKHCAHWNGRALSSLTTPEIATWHARMAQTLKTRCNRIHALLRTVYNFGCRHGYCTANPATGVRHVPEQSRERYLTPVEMPRFLDALRTGDDPTFRDFVLLALMTGQRRGNLSKMQWRALDLEAGTWTLAGSETKNKSSMMVPLIPPAVKLLEERRKVVPKSNPWVLPSNMDPSKPYANPKKAWSTLIETAELFGLCDQLGELAEQDAMPLRAQALDRVAALRAEALARKPKEQQPLDAVLEEMRAQVVEAGGDPTTATMTDLRFHDLRRSAGSWMACAGIPLQTIGKALGHKSLQATQIYARLDLDAQKAALSTAFSAMIGGAK